METRISYPYHGFNVVDVKDRLNLEISSKTTEISLYGNKIDALATRVLMNILIGEDHVVEDHGSVTLRAPLAVLDLWQNTVGPQGAEYVAKALKKGLPLLSLNLASNYLYGLGISEFKTALMYNDTLTSFSIGNNALNDVGMVVLSDILKTNKTLTALYVDGNKVGSVGVNSLFSALPFNNTLETLYLSNNPLGDEWTADAGQTLGKNSTLSSLHLAKCGITDAGISQLSEAKNGILSYHQSLTTLDLTGNNITEEGWVFAGVALETNVSLLNLYLSEYDENNKRIFSNQASEKVSTLLARNKQIAESCSYSVVASELRNIRLLTTQRASTTIINKAFRHAIEVANGGKSQPLCEFPPRKHLAYCLEAMHKRFQQPAPILKISTPVTVQAKSMFKDVSEKVKSMVTKLLPSDNTPKDYQIESCLDSFKQALIRRIRKEREHEEAYEKIMYIVDNIIVYYNKKHLFKSLAFKPNHNIYVINYLKQLSYLMDAENPSLTMTNENIIDMLSKWQSELPSNKFKDTLLSVNDGLFGCIEDIKQGFLGVTKRLRQA